MPGPTHTIPERPRRFAVVALFALALLVRLLALWAASDVVLVKDEIAYVERAHALLDGRGYLGSYQSWVLHEGWKIAELPQYPGAYQPPGYPTFMAAVMALTGRSIPAVKVVQCLLGALSCVLVFGIGRAWFGHRVGIAAASICALYPNLVVFNHLLWSETLFIFELLLCLWLLYGTGEAERDESGVGGLALPSASRAILAGGVLGAAALTRGTIAYFVPVLLLWIPLLAAGLRGWPTRAELRGQAWRAGIGRAALVLLAAAVVVMPWSIRNRAELGDFVLIDTNGPYNLWRGNAPGALGFHGDPRVPHYSWPFDAFPLHPVANLTGRVLVERVREATEKATPTDREITSYATRDALSHIIRDPGRFAGAAILKLGDMWNPTSFTVRHFELGAYGVVGGSVRIAVSTVAVLAYLGLVVVAAIGVGRLLGDRRVWLVLTAVLYFSALSAVAFGLTRFRLPLVPLLAIPAGWVLCQFSARSGKTHWHRGVSEGAEPS